MAAIYRLRIAEHRFGVTNGSTLYRRKTYVDHGGHIRDETITHTRIDLRESLFAFVRSEFMSRDTVLLEVLCVMFYKIVDVRKAIYEVRTRSMHVAFVQGVALIK